MRTDRRKAAANAATLVALALLLAPSTAQATGEAPIGWQEAVPIYANYSCSCAGGDLGLVADPSGFATMVYGVYNPSSSTTTLMATRFNLTTGYSDGPVAISGASLSPTGARVVSDERGNILVVWSDYYGTAGLNYSRFKPGDGWSPAAPVYDAGFAHTFRPSLSMNPQGEAILAWSFYDGNNTSSLWTAGYAPATGWSGPEQVLLGLADLYGEPQAHLDASGGATLLYSQGGNLSALRRPAGALWGTPERVRGGGYAISDFSLAVSPRGGALAAWMEFSTMHEAAVRVSLYQPGGGWSFPETFTVPGEGQGQHPIAGADDYGDYLVLWIQSGSGGNASHLLARRYSAASGWEARAILDGTAGGGWFPTMTVDRLGNAFAAWWQEGGISIWPYSGLTVDVRASVYNYSEGWSNSSVVGPGDAGTSPLPVVAADSRGNAVALWGYNYGVKAARYLGAADTTPPAPVFAKGANGTTTNESSYLVEGTVEPRASVWVSGDPVPVSPNGSFSARVNLTEGRNAIPVLAKDPAGNTVSRTLVVFRSGPSGGSSGQPPPGGTSTPGGAAPSLLESEIFVGTVTAVAAGAAVFFGLRRFVPPAR